MNTKIKSERYRKISIAALVLGLLIIIPFLVINLVALLVTPGSGGMNLLWTLIFMMYALPTSVAAIVCGSIDLKRIKAGLYSKKGRGMDITGITVGSLFIIPGIFLVVFWIS